MSALGLSSDGLFATGDFTQESGMRAARELLQRPDRASAIIASNDQMAFGVLSVAAELGLTVPEDLSVISFDNSPGVRFCQPPLTAIDQPISETASIAAELIIATQRGVPVATDRISVPAKLVERASVAAPAI